MTPINPTCPCGKPSTGLAWYRPTVLQSDPIHVCSMRCWGRVDELKGQLPQTAKERIHA